FYPEVRSVSAWHGPHARNETSRNHVVILAEFIKKTYASTTEQLHTLFKGSQITYDSLWALFKLNTNIYTQCQLTRTPRFMKWAFGEEEERSDRTKYYHLECQFLGWDGKILRDSTIVFKIENFSGWKQNSVKNDLIRKLCVSR